MIEMPFRTPELFEGAVAAAAPTESAHWFVFRGDRLLVELGPPSPHPSGDLRVPARPSWAKLPLQKSNNLLWFEPARTLYLGRLGEIDCWAAEAPAEAPPPPMLWQPASTIEAAMRPAAITPLPGDRRSGIQRPQVT